MLHPLRSHIIYLENTIQSLRDRLTRSNLTIEQVEDIELQLSLSESALDHYRQAYALELKISSSEPPNHPTGTEGRDGGQGGEKSSVIKKKEGLVAAEAGVCRRLILRDQKLSTICRCRALTRQAEPRLCAMTAELG
jgi:hypothetical protein